ncbi:MAG: response regulator transcription factor [Lachnospiraceae bacterium]|nr:response regulator transcription factor [Lachnospiraceae bacterium]
MVEKNEAKLIYVCDDDKNISELIKMYLENDGFEVKTFDTGEKLLSAVRTKLPNLITLDIMLPGINGFDALEKIRDKNDVPVILVSAKDNEVDKVRGFNEGSDDYIVKPFMPLELVARVKNVLRRFEKAGTKVERKVPEALDFSNVHIETSTMQVFINKKSVSFTNIEYKFLVYMFERQKEAVTKKDILADVWGYEEDDNRVIDDLLKRLRKKLDENKAKLSIETIWGVGYRLSDGAKKS